MILNCRRVALAYSEEKVIFGLHPPPPRPASRRVGGVGGVARGEAAAKNGIFHKNKIKRRTQ